LEIREVVGIDVGKEKLDVHVHSRKISSSFKNTITEIKAMVNWAIKKSAVEKTFLLFVFEHTGLYSQTLALYLSEKEYNFVMIPGLEIKRSLGLSRGKSDKIDAEKIAQYGYRRREELSPYIIDVKEVSEIKKLLSLREKLVTQRAGYKSTFGEYKKFMKRKENEILFSVHEKMIKELTKQIEKIESKIDGIIKSNSKIKKQYELINTIKGVGPQTALFMIAYTNGFTRFQTWRKFASYCGIAPFPHSSGKSLKGKTKVSGLANKKIKSLLDMCAKTAIQSNPEMKVYYMRRVSEGKEKMSTINIIRNKLLSRIFAVVNRETPYVNTYAYCG
jgi:transposase